MAGENKRSHAAKQSADKSQPYRIDLFQSSSGGMVLVDALLPQWIVDRLMALVATI